MNPNAPASLFRILVFAIGSFVIAGCMIAFSGCAGPGAAGFKDLRRSNAREKVILKAAAVQTENIGKHVAAADALALKLAATKLTDQQAQWLSELRVQLKATQDERDALKLSITGVRAENEQQAATINETQGAVKAAVKEAWWNGLKFVLGGELLLFVILAVVGVLFRASIRAGFIAASAYPPVGAALSFLRR